MSERLIKTSNKVTNEEIVNELTKNLASSLISDDLSKITDPGTSVKYKIPSSEIPNKTDIPYSDCDVHKDYNSNNKDSDTDSIDEISLKDAEIDLTDDQKAKRQVVAEELKVAGNQSFKVGEFERSIEKYTEALRICPLQFCQLRSILYCNRSAAKMKLEAYDKAIKDCTKAIELDEKYQKAYLRRAQSYESTNKLDECLEDYKKILELDPSNKEALAAQVRLPPMIQERNEKLKTEMMGKLKDLGNMILKPFGLSTSNFQMEQDPDSKGYKINFKH